MKILTKKIAPNYKTAQNVITKLRSSRITKLRKIFTNLRNNCKTAQCTTPIRASNAWKHKSVLRTRLVLWLRKEKKHEKYFKGRNMRRKKFSLFHGFFAKFSKVFSHEMYFTKNKTKSFEENENLIQHKSLTMQTLACDLFAILNKTQND